MVEKKKKQPVVTISLDSFENLLNMVVNKSDYANHIWRGESSIKFELVPSALRKANFEKFYNESYGLSSNSISNMVGTQFFQIKTELKLLKTFLRNADKRGLLVPKIETIRSVSHLEFDLYDAKKWISPECYEIAGLAQHYGIPTRLLDWSYDFFTSLYFACIGALEADRKGTLDPTDNIVIWALGYTQIDLFHMSDKTKLRIIKPPYHGNPNLSAQAGLFTLWEIDFIKFGRSETPGIIDRTPLDKLIQDQYEFKVLTKFIIPISERFAIYQFLHRMNWDAAKLFPGYDGVRKAMQELSMVKLLMQKHKIPFSYTIP